MSIKNSQAVHQLADSYARQLQDQSSGHDWEQLENDELADELDEFDFDAYREQRREQLAQEMRKARDLHGQGYGHMQDCTDEKAFLDMSVNTETMVASIYHKDFQRCHIMEKHLRALASKYWKTKFVRMDAEQAPFLCTRLAIRVLPCVLLFRKGNLIDRVVGFDELGNTDNFPTSVLEARISKSGVLKSGSESQGQDWMSARMSQNSSTTRLTSSQTHDSQDSDIED